MSMTEKPCPEVRESFVRLYQGDAQPWLVRYSGVIVLRVIIGCIEACAA